MMVTSQSPVAGGQKDRPRSGRKPLQPRNFLVDPLRSGGAKANPKQEWSEVASVGDSNKENEDRQKSLIPVKIEPIYASLAEELSAMRRRIERLRLDRDKTEKMLEERDRVLEVQMRELENRGEEQKQLEMEVDRLYRLKQLRSACVTISPIRSLREKERGKMEEAEGQDAKAQEEEEESVGENVTGSPKWEALEVITENEI